MIDRIKFYLSGSARIFFQARRKWGFDTGYDRRTRTLSVFTFLALKSRKMVILNLMNKCERCDNKAIVHTAPDEFFTS